MKSYILLTFAALLLGEVVLGEDVPASQWETGNNKTSTSDNCGYLAGTWTGTFSFVSSSCHGSFWTCPNVRLIFEDAAGDGSAFFVERPAVGGCSIDHPDCHDGALSHMDYIAFCENSKVDMEGFEGLVSSTKLILSKDPQSDGQYDMHK